mmetsp:Transcript_23616/g.38487  ORF Transcript_23616/g.38487 Transcript_23616/m.38487 type:complete len:238 (+) Transcript_23616:23-736(+)
MSELRHRPVSEQTMTNNRTSNDDETDAFVPGVGLAAQSLIDSSPQHHGVVLKLHIPLLYSILPEFLQRFVLSWSFLSFLAPTWKQRHLVLCGSYLYKFQDRSSSVPKGCPFEVEGVNVNIVHIGDVPQFCGGLPPGYNAMFSVSTLRRNHFYAVLDSEEAMLWVRSLQEARQEAIKRKMGHAANMPYPNSWKYFDSLGNSLVQSKFRIRDKMEEFRLREMEMTNFAEAGPLPGAYHG